MTPIVRPLNFIQPPTTAVSGAPAMVVQESGRSIPAATLSRGARSRRTFRRGPRRRGRSVLPVRGLTPRRSKGDRPRRQGGRLRGASTITQQVAKNLFLWEGRSFIRKGLEVYLTLVLEVCLPKERILDLYLNLAEWGDGVFGAEMAARTHFRKPASRLTRDEAARLAAILPAPRRWPPMGSIATRRAAIILERMAYAAPRDEPAGKR